MRPAFATTLLALLLLATLPLAAQSLSSVAPTELRRGETQTLIIRGESLGAATGLSLSGTGISIQSVLVWEDRIEAQIGVAQSAALGPRNLYIDGLALEQEDALSIVPGAPSLLSVQPATLTRGQEALVTVRGTNLDIVSTWSLGTDIEILEVLPQSATQTQLSLRAGTHAASGLHRMDVGAGHQTASLTSLRINPGAARIDSISPGSVLRDTPSTLLVQGENLDTIDTFSLGHTAVVGTLTAPSPGELRVPLTVRVDALAGPTELQVRAGEEAVDAPPLTILPGDLQVSSVTPGRVQAGTQVNLRISGSNLDQITSIVGAPGITLGDLVLTTPRQASAELTLAAELEPGIYDLNFETATGSLRLRDALVVSPWEPPSLQFSLSESMDLESTAIGACRRAELRIRNDGAQEETLELVVAEGDPVAFGLLGAGGARHTRLHVLVAPGAQADASVEFCPQLRGSAAARIQVLARDSELVGVTEVFGFGSRRTLTWAPESPLVVRGNTPGEPAHIPPIATEWAGGDGERSVRIRSWEARAHAGGAAEPLPDDFTLSLLHESGDDLAHWGETILALDLTFPVQALTVELLLETDATEAPWMRYEIRLTPEGDEEPELPDGETRPDAGQPDTGHNPGADTGSNPGADTGHAADVGTDSDDTGSETPSHADDTGCCAMGGASPPPAPWIALLALLLLKRRSGWEYSHKPPR